MCDEILIREQVANFTPAIDAFLASYDNMNELEQVIIGNRLKQEFGDRGNVDRLVTLMRLVAGLPTCMNCGNAYDLCGCCDAARIENGE